MSEAKPEARENGGGSIRDTVKWIIAAFAAPLAIMVGTSPLTNLGALPARPLAVALMCGAVGIVTIIYAIKQASDILVLQTFFLGDIKGELAKYIDTHATDVLPPRFRTLSAFTTERMQLAAKLDSEKDEAKRELLLKNWETIRAATARIVRLSNYEHVRQQFAHVRLRLMIAAVVGALALFGFAWASGAPVKADPKPSMNVYCQTPTR